MKPNEILMRIMTKDNVRQKDLSEKTGMKQTALSNTTKRENMGADKFAFLLKALGYKAVIVPIDSEVDGYELGE